MSYTYTVNVPLSWEDAVQRTRAVLSEQGFGILTEIDVRSTFETKLGIDAGDAVGDYIILGACNPTLASRALAADPALGALLPCNVVVRRGKNARETTVEAMDPQTMVQLSDSPVVRAVADDADARLREALHRLTDAAGASPAAL
ncbi:DUF302 domain-containing protein [Pseudarthrobacter sp. AL07]|uniref:DUF302 domain-containing protein n=1 Tax=unclassified Pseudarthrobacter TaxID=2647000 RepID=UPI00249B5138|nr:MULTISPECIES: DUF302 domain-containing protein [unclassified Pseudarthrobacter]MDI3195881.1 DUF302 domain-containing protein [Pseudarthrobacter sp. AL20]MDI3209577.1 DUF302 domain-containing protein [Pseudarthrobacter sp. AL07]